MSAGITQNLIAFEQLVRRLDRWVADAFDIPKVLRNDGHEKALDRSAMLVIWLDTMREPIPRCQDVIHRLQPYLEVLTGMPSWPESAQRCRMLREIMSAFESIQA